jgi:hypothetical protein
MRYALIVIDAVAYKDPDKLQDRIDFSKALSDITKGSEGLEILSDNVLLLCLEKSLSAFGNVLHAAHETGFAYRVLFLDDPQWFYSSRR